MEGMAKGGAGPGIGVDVGGRGRMYEAERQVSPGVSWSQMSCEPFSTSLVRSYTSYSLPPASFACPFLPSSHQAPIPISSHSSISLYLGRNNFQLLHLCSSHPFLFSFCPQYYALSFPISFLPYPALLDPFLPSPFLSLLPFLPGPFLPSPPAIHPPSPAPVITSPQFPSLTFNLLCSPFSIL